MFINYEHENHIYNVTVERRGDKFFIIYNNNEYTVNATEIKPGQLKIKLGDRIIKCIISEGKESKFVFIGGDVFRVKRIELTGRKKTEKKEGDLNSPISGTVVKVKVKEGSKVKKDDVIMIIEAMKMFNQIEADVSGTVVAILAENGQPVEYDQPLFLVDPS